MFSNNSSSAECGSAVIAEQRMARQDTASKPVKPRQAHNNKNENDNKNNDDDGDHDENNNHDDNDNDNGNDNDNDSQQHMVCMTLHDHDRYITNTIGLLLAPPGRKFTKSRNLTSILDLRTCTV